MKAQVLYKLLFTFSLLSLWATVVFGQTDITDTGGTISAQYSDSPENAIAKLTDNSSKTKYLTFHSAGWVQYKASQSYVVTKYAITSANDLPAQDPKSWILQASNNGSLWTTIDTQSNQTFATRQLRKEFTFTNTVAYAYYRLNIESKNANVLHLAEWEIYGAMNIVDITSLPGEISTQYNDSPAGESVWELIDNQAATKFLTFKNATWTKFQQGNPSVVTSYTLTSANDAEERDPLNWTFQASNDDITWTTLDTRNNEDFATRFLKREFSFANTNAYTYYRLNMINNDGGILQIAEWEIFGTGGGGTVPLANPPATWQEHWFEHNEVLSLVYFDNDVAVYYDKDVNPSVTWPYQYLGDVWRYTKKVYGNFGKNPRMYAILHGNKYSGGHPSGYFDASHDYRNVIDVGPGPWTSFDYGAVAIPTHEVAHIVEGDSKGSHGSPAFGLWGDSKWAEIYNYDVYRGLGRDDFATRWYNEQINRSDNFPRANTYWFRDWFFPIYRQYGESKVLNEYFTLLAKCFPKKANSYDYARAMNWGEFVHFWSGAAGVNLKSLATNAFGWTETTEAQFKQAQADFKCFRYTDTTLRSTENETITVIEGKADNKISVWYNSTSKEVNIVDEGTKALRGSATVYSLFGNTVLTSDLKNSRNVASVDASRLTPGVYILVVNVNNKIYRERIVVK